MDGSPTLEDLKEIQARLKTRQRAKGATRYYADLRDFGAVGGGMEALKPAGSGRATTDEEIATALLWNRLQELRELKRLHDLGLPAPPSSRASDEETPGSLAAYAADHLLRKARDGEATERWLLQAERHLRLAVEFFGADVPLAALEPKDFTRWVDHLRTQDNGRGGTLSDATIRKHLNSVSNLFARAVSDRVVAMNPVADMYVKPTEKREEARFLTPEEAARFLEAARTFRPRVEDGAFPWAYQLIATLMLTGGRKSEVLGLEVGDVSIEYGKVYFRPNRWRRLKTRGSKRSVPLWPQLEEILRPYLRERAREDGLSALLFPSTRLQREGMVTDIRKMLDRVAEHAGFAPGQVRAHGLRHTYTAARIQTLEGGAPVQLYTVARELGHRSVSMIEDRYGHLHDRAATGAADVVEFRVGRQEEPAQTLRIGSKTG